MAISLKNIELFKTGITNDGRFISNQRIKKIVEDTILAMKDGFHPKAKIGYEHETSQSRGIITSLNYDELSICGDVEFPMAVYEKLIKGVIPEERSIEIGKGFVLSDGTVLPEVLTGVVFGIDVPAIHNLKSIFDKFKKAESYERFSGKIKNLNKNQGGNHLEEIMKLLNTIMEKIQDMEKNSKNDDNNDSSSKEDFSSYLEPEMKSLTEVFAHLSGENEKLQKQNHSLISEIETYENQFKESFINKMIHEKRIFPAQKDEVTQMYEVFTEKYGRVEAQTKINELIKPSANFHTGHDILVNKPNNFDNKNNEISPIEHQ